MSRSSFLIQNFPNTDYFHAVDTTFTSDLDTYVCILRLPKGFDIKGLKFDAILDKACRLIPNYSSCYYDSAVACVEIIDFVNTRRKTND